jgi:hypothetical protein
MTLSPEKKLLENKILLKLSEFLSILFLLFWFPSFIVKKASKVKYIYEKKYISKYSQKGNRFPCNDSNISGNQTHIKFHIKHQQKFLVQQKHLFFF